MAVSSAPQTGHVRKRPYQPSISSYFSRNSNGPSSSAPDDMRSPMSPPLPPDTQASLLSVGMRVRKSVPEGYKTHKTMGVQEFPFPSTAPVVQAREIREGTSPGRELTPFCGLHKIGGWGPQEIPPSSAPAAMGRAGNLESSMPGMSISQSTLSTTEGSFDSSSSTEHGNYRKRTYEDDVEDDLDAYFNDTETETENPILRPERPMAKLKSQGKKDSAVLPTHAPSGSDFEEAAFLSPIDGMDVDGA